MCPFCGSKAELRYEGKNGIKIKCTGCLAKMSQKVIHKSLEWLEEVMIKEWNTRINH